MKKVLSVLLAVLMLVSVGSLFAACTKEKTDDKKENSTDSSAQSSDLAYVQDKGELVIGITLFAPMDYYTDEAETELTGLRLSSVKQFAKSSALRLSSR